MIDENKPVNIFKEISDLPPELKNVSENIKFEKDIVENPIPPKMGEVSVFGCETWDINSILKGNYWRRSIYTTDKLCKLFLKADLNQKKKYLAKKNPLGFDFTFALILVIGVVVVIMAIIFLLPKLTGGG